MEEIKAMKYELTEETVVTPNGVTLHRIRALIDFADVKAGELGGFVEKLKNLDARVSENAWVSGNAWVFGNAWEKSPLQIQGTKHFLTVSSHTELSIGCECHTFAVWLEQYEAIGKKNGYSDAEIAEYGQFIRLAAEWVKIIAPAPEAPKP